MSKDLPSCLFDREPLLASFLASAGKVVEIEVERSARENSTNSKRKVMFFECDKRIYTQ